MRLARGMHMSARQAITIVILAAIAVAMGLLSDSASAGTASSIDNLLFDVDPSDNTATSIGPVETCLDTSPNRPIVVDAVTGPQGLPESYLMAGFQFEVKYDPAVLQLLDVDVNFLLAAAPNTYLFDLSDPLPDPDGKHLVAAADFSGNNENGPGTLARLAFRTVGTGSSLITFTDPIIAQASRLSPPVLPVDHIGMAVITVGGPSCHTIDTDGDGTPELRDNCYDNFNPDQTDTDSDGLGNVCDDDDDGDGVSDEDERLRSADPLDPNNTPEDVFVDWDSCFDGVDNDGDGLTDLEDGRCPFMDPPPPPPPNDNFADAIQISSSPFQDYRRLLSATVEASEPLPCGNTGPTVWYSFTPSSEVAAKVDSGHDSQTAIYVGTSLNDLTLLDCGSGDVIVDLPAASTVYFQTVADDDFNPSGDFSFSLDADNDGVFDDDDNCQDAPNRDQVDSDHDRIGDACDPTPWHDVALTDLGASTAIIRYRDATATTMSVTIEVANLAPVREMAKVQVAPFLPHGCRVAVVVGDHPRVIEAESAVVFQLRLSIACDPGLVIPGHYPINISAQVQELSSAEREMDSDNNSATEAARLHIQ